MKIENNILNILSEATIDSGVVKLTCGTLDRATYTRVNKVLEILGGKWSKKAKGHTFEADPTEVLESAILYGEVTDLKKQYQFFPTPRAVAEQLVAMAQCEPGMTILEPSAGHGAIADMLHRPDVIELSPENRKVLQSNGYEVLTDDFLKFEGKYDRIVANPPFAKQQDIIHVNHMLDCLNPKGRLVSVLSNGFLFRTDKRTQALRDRLDAIAVNGGSYTCDKLPEGAFAESGTLVSTCVLMVQL